MRVARRTGKSLVRGPYEGRTHDGSESNPYDGRVTFPHSKALTPWMAQPGARTRLDKVDAGGTPLAPKDGDRAATEAATKKLREELRDLQGRLQAEEKRSILLVLQAMDTGGKDGTAKSIYAGVNPAGVEMHSFGVPSELERSHDFLWRIHAVTPAAGRIAIFNRSHYEDVLAVRVRNIAPPTVWRPRFDIINNFEAGLTAAGTTVVKMMLHISKDEQQQRLQARIDRPDKRWKFRMGDLEDRQLWQDYMHAYEDVLAKTSTPHAPWFVIPADKKWYRDFATLTILVHVLRGLRPAYPPCPELDGTIIPK